MPPSTKNTSPVSLIISCFVLSFWSLTSNAQDPRRDMRMERRPQRIAQAWVDPVEAKETEVRAQGFPLGRPLEDAHATEDGGRFRAFENASIYWSEATGAHLVYGLIGAKWAEMGNEKSPLGYPLTDELPGPQPNVGRFNDFQHGMIRWTPDQGVNVLYDAMLLRRAAIGGKRSAQSSSAQSDEPVVTRTVTEDGSVKIETRYPDGRIVVPGPGGSFTTTYPDGHTEFTPPKFLEHTAQAPNPPLRPSDDEMLVRWREFTARQLLDIVKLITKSDQAVNNVKNSERSRNLNPYEQINLRLDIISALLP
jgi:uncharacterized protein with LGFP repeats